MRVLSLPGGVASLQKCYLPMMYFDKLGAYLNKYVTINIKEGYCIVKLNFNGNLHDCFCQVNDAVCSWVRSFSSTLFRGELNTLNIIPQDGPFMAKIVNISIVFENIEHLVAWKKRINSKHVLLNILELYVVSSGANIFLSGIEEYLNLGIVYITVNRVRGKINIDEAVFKFTSKTNIIVDCERSEKMMQSETSVYGGGVEKPFRLLTDVVNQHRLLKSSVISRNVLLFGPSGSGKRTLVHKVAKYCDALVVEIDGRDILCPKDGQGRPGEVEAYIRSTFELIGHFCEQLNTYGDSSKFSKASTKPKNAKVNVYSSPFVILLLTHVELMCPNRKQGLGCQTSQLLGAMDSLQHLDNLLIFATSSAVDDLDQAIRRPGRLDTEVYVGVPSEVERSEIIEEVLLWSGGRLVVRGDWVRMAAALTPGRVPADLSLLCRQVKWMHLQQRHAEGGDCSRWLDDFTHCATQLPVSSLLDGPGTLIGGNSLLGSGGLLLSSIGGLQGIKERLLVSVREPLLHPESFRRLGINPPGGVLLFGPPGCAKTTLARALAFPSSATAHAITFLSSSAAELYSPFVGESERTVMELFRRARAGAPSIVFIDELDALFGSRDGMRKGGVQERVLAALLMELDGVGHRLVAPVAAASTSDQMMVDSGRVDCTPKGAMISPRCTMEPFPQVTLIAATNRPDLIDDALLRPGRLDQLIYVPPPDEGARLDILSHYTEGMPIIRGGRGGLLRDVAERTALYSGADLKNLCKEAALMAISEEGFGVSEVKEKHFAAALKSTRSSLTPDMLMSYQTFCDNTVF